MNVAAVVQAVTAAVLSYFATKGFHLDAHSQVLLVSALTLVASWVLPAIKMWQHAHAREIGALLGVLAIVVQIVASLNLGGEVQAIVTGFVTLLASLGIPAAAHQAMPAPAP